MKLQEDLEGIAFENGYEIATTNGLVVVGISLGNSYFKKDIIASLLTYCSKTFSSVKIMIADVPAEHTYRAFGYSAKIAEKKARLNGNVLQNHCRRSIDKILCNVTLLEWATDIEQDSNYAKELHRILQMYDENLSFRVEVRNTTKRVLEGKLKKDMKLEEAIDEGINYLLKELAFLSASPKMFGVERVAYAYHDRWSIYEHFISGVFDGNKRTDLGFIVVR